MKTKTERKSKEPNKPKEKKTKRKNKTKIKESTKRDLLDFLNIDRDRIEFVSKKGLEIRLSSDSDGNFLKKLMENNELNNNEKLLISYKVGQMDGVETVIEKMDRDFSEFEKTVSKDRESENKCMYG